MSESPAVNAEYRNNRYSEVRTKQIRVHCVWRA